MIRMGRVWDSTVAVLGGRGALIARVALLTVFLPSVIQAALPLAIGEAHGARLAGGVAGLILIVVTLLGTLAITALASDPAVDERGAYAAARDTLPATIGAVLLIGVAMALLLIPGAVLLVAAGFDANAMEAGAPQPTLASGPALGAALYFFVYALVVLWAVARLLPLYAVLVGERCGLRSIRRAFALTRGLALRIVAVLILYAVVLMVAWSATTSVFGLVFRLLLGSDHAMLVGFLSGVAGAVVTTAFGVLQPVFAARLYAAIREVREGAPAGP